MAVHRPRVCHRCKRPLRETQGYKKIEGRFTNYYCDEHIVLTATGWRLLEPGEVPPPPVGSHEAAAADAAASSPAADPLAGSIPWDDTEPPLPAAPASPDDAYEAVEPMRHIGTVASVPPAKPFNPLDDVGF